MTVQTSTLTPESIQSLESEQLTFHPTRGPGNYRRPMSQQFLDAGLDPKAALRHDMCSTRFIDHKLKGGKKVKENINPCHEYSLCNNCAMLRSEEAIEHYRPLGATLKDEFTFITTPNLESFSKVRKLLETLNVILLANLVVWHKTEKRFVVRAALLIPKIAIPYILLQAIAKLDPSICLDRYGSSRYMEALRDIFSPDLPPDAANRLKLKKTKRKIVFTGASQEVRKKLSDKDSKKLSDNFSGDEPFCHHKDCIAHTNSYFVGTPENEKSYYTRPPPLEQAA